MFKFNRMFNQPHEMIEYFVNCNTCTHSALVEGISLLGLHSTCKSEFLNVFAVFKGYEVA